MRDSRVPEWQRDLRENQSCMHVVYRGIGQEEYNESVRTRRSDAVGRIGDVINSACTITAEAGCCGGS